MIIAVGVVVVVPAMINPMTLCGWTSAARYDRDGTCLAKTNQTDRTPQPNIVGIPFAFSRYYFVR